MQAVSAVKMRKTESAALRGRPFALYAIDILRKIERGVGENIKELSPLFVQRDIKKSLVVVIASDKGLAGAFNSNVFRFATSFLKEKTSPVSIVAVGKRAKEFFEKNNFTVIKSFDGIGDLVNIDEVKHITEFVVSSFIDKSFDSVDVIYTEFVSALKQEVVHRPLLPLNRETLDTVIDNIVPETGKFSDIRKTEDIGAVEYKFEPSGSLIVEKLVPTLVELEIFHSILEANASEHAARMVAMKNASENAKEVIGSLTISYNKARQAQITKELIEIVSGKEALAALED
jgi:F-type H+-transporting ATPase subunit gamma